MDIYSCAAIRANAVVCWTDKEIPIGMICSSATLHLDATASANDFSFQNIGSDWNAAIRCKMKRSLLKCGLNLVKGFFIHKCWMRTFHDAFLFALYQHSSISPVCQNVFDRTSIPHAITVIIISLQALCPSILKLNALVIGIRIRGPVFSS